MTLKESNFEEYKVNDVLARIEEPYDALSHQNHFVEEAKRYSESGDETGAELFQLFSALSSMYLDLTDPKEPLQPQWILEKHRAPIPDDFKDEQLNFLSDIVDDVTEKNMQARIAEVIWLRKRNHKFARLAHESYLDTVNLENLTHYTQEHVIRAMQIAKQLNDQVLSDRAVQVARQVADMELIAGNVAPWSWLYEQIARHIAEYDQAELERIAELIWQQATNVEQKGDWDFATRLKERSIRIFGLSKNKFWVQESRRELLETLTSYAQRHAENGDYWKAYSSIEQAFEHLKKIDSKNGLREKLHRLLNEYSSKISENMDWQESKITLPQEELDQLNNLTKQVIENIKGKSLEDALLELANFPHAISLSAAQEGAETFLQESVFAQLVSTRSFGRTGKVESRKISFATAGFYATQFRNMYFTFVILPAIQLIVSEHQIETENLYPIFNKSDFIPEHLVKSFTLAMVAGFKQDFFSVAHILPMLIESALRDLLTTLGIVTSKLREDLVEEERSLDWILRHPALQKLLGVNLMFDLLTVLVRDEEMGGSNIRNMVAHGLLPDNVYFQEGESYNEVHRELLYLWWLALKLSFIIQRRQNGDDTALEEVGDE